MLLKETGDEVAVVFVLVCDVPASVGFVESDGKVVIGFCESFKYRYGSFFAVSGDKERTDKWPVDTFHIEERKRS